MLTGKSKTPIDPEARKVAQEMADKMRKAEDLLRQHKEEEKARKKEKNARLMAFMKEWHKVKEDQELEDHKVNKQDYVLNSTQKYLLQMQFNRKA